VLVAGENGQVQRGERGRAITVGIGALLPTTDGIVDFTLGPKPPSP
jgi:hypothetical protein